MKSKFGKILTCVVLVWLLALIGLGIKFYVDQKVPNQDQLAIKKLENLLVEFYDETGKFPSSSNLSTYDSDLESDITLMNWLRKEDQKPEDVKALIDSKGNLFRIRMDGNNDKAVYSPIDKEPIKYGVIVWSAGNDGNFETWRDNGRSWE